MEGTLCPKCSKPVETDARVCLSCGCRLQGGEKQIKFSPPDSKVFSKNTSASFSASPVSKKVKSSGSQKAGRSSFLSGFFSFCFFLFTLGFAYGYLFDISKILIVPNLLLEYGQVQVASGVLSIMKKAVLSKDKAYVSFKAAQVNQLNKNTTSAGTELDFQDIQGRWTEKGLVLDFTLENRRPFAMPVTFSCFFIRVYPDCYRSAEPLPGNTNKSVNIQAWKSMKMSLLFEKSPLLKAFPGGSKASLIFNDGKTCSSRDIVLPDKK